MSVQLEIRADERSAAAACAEYLLARLRRGLEERPHATLAISGGTTPKFLFQEMAQAGLPWERLHLFWVDERSVPPGHPRSNYRLAEEFLIQPAGIPSANVHRIPAEREPREAADAYVREVREFFRLAPGELPEMDAVQLGIGDDAHTASLFPGEPLIADREGIAAALYAEADREWRITLLPGVLLNARNTAFLTAGAGKAQAVANVLREPSDVRLYPAQLFVRQGRNVAWFLDEPAASRVE
ncbi:MAG: 6-phosphogluconolactonase [Bryobacteraceae bacterium]